MEICSDFLIAKTKIIYHYGRSNKVMQEIREFVEFGSHTNINICH